MLSAVRAWRLAYAHPLRSSAEVVSSPNIREWGDSLHSHWCESKIEGHEDAQMYQMGGRTRFWVGCDTSFGSHGGREENGYKRDHVTLLPEGHRLKQQILELYSLLHPVDFVPIYPVIEKLQSEFIKFPNLTSPQLLAPYKPLWPPGTSWIASALPHRVSYMASSFTFLSSY